MDTKQDEGLGKNERTGETAGTEPNEDVEPLKGEEQAAEESAEKEAAEAAEEKEPAADIEEAEGVTAEAVEEAETMAPEEEEAAEEKEKPVKEVEEEEIVEERIYTIPLRRAWISPRKKRAPRAVRLVRSHILRHMKVETGGEEGEEEKGRLVISNEVNEKLWSRGIEKPPRNIRIRAVKDKEGTVTLYLAEGD